VTAGVLLAGRDAAAQQVVIITLPSAVGFSVTDVNQATTGSPNPTSVSFTTVSLLLFHVLRVSVKADADFSPPSGTAIPASRVSWTTSNASGSTGSSGTLSTASYGQVLQTNAGLIGSGGLNVTWTLSAPGTGIRAGTHTAVVRWKLESVIP
jgi:hypothetical protein